MMFLSTHLLIYVISKCGKCTFLVSPILITSTCSALIVALLRQILTLNKLSLKTSSLLRWDGGDGHDVDDHDHLHNRWHHHGDLACGVDLASFYGGG